ncbi:MAG: NADH-quinone oxidoreductase subunit NuoN [Helicobacter sp.]|nr:NADH-quinone oxidoreductase subunit NuoN [Helicobacter sp.]
MLEPLSIPTDSLNIASIIPMLISFVGASVVLVAGVFAKVHKNFTALLSVLFLLANLLYLLQIPFHQEGFFTLVRLDGYALIAQTIVLVGTLGFALLTLTKGSFSEYRYPEFHALLLYIAAGLQFMVSTTHLMMMIIGLECAALATYTLIAMHNRANAIEAAIKYFTQGALACALFCLGAAFLYFGTGELDLLRIGQRIAHSEILSDIIVLAGILLIFAALAFKIALVPFHAWSPDMYEGASAMMAGFVSIVPKIGAFVVTMRFFGVFLEAYSELQIALYTMAVLSMTLANLLALVQTDAKRMLAYSSIAQAGFGISAILIHTPESVNALFIYWVVFFVTNLGAFGMLYLAQPLQSPQDGKSDFAFERFASLASTSPLAAVLIAIFMLSLSGVPPFALFWGKITLISAALQADFVVLAFIMAANSAIAAFYYLRLIVYCFFVPKSTYALDGACLNPSVPLKIVLIANAIIATCALLWLQQLLDFIQHYTTLF